MHHVLFCKLQADFVRQRTGCAPIVHGAHGVAAVGRGDRRSVRARLWLRVRERAENEVKLVYALRHRSGVRGVRITRGSGCAVERAVARR